MTKGPSVYKVQVYMRSDGKWDWRLIAPNGKRMCGSEPQGYNSKGDARRAWYGMASILTTRTVVVSGDEEAV